MAATHSSQSKQVIRGVNLGGWLVLEKWMTPSLFDAVNTGGDPPNDEYGYCKALGHDEAKRRLEQHYRDWVSEDEIKRLSQAGLTHLRIPIGHWEFAPSDDEPYVAEAGLPYLAQAIRWAGKYGMKVIPEIHTAPGSQNGFDNSGRQGPINWTDDPNNVERSVDAAVGLAKFVSSSDLRPYIEAIGTLNEIQLSTMDWSQLECEFYTPLYEGIREVDPSLPIIIDRGFKDFEFWKSHKSDEWQNVIYDSHLYHVFGDGWQNMTLSQHIDAVCHDGDDIAANADSIPTMIGEWSLALPSAAFNGSSSSSSSSSSNSAPSSKGLISQLVNSLHLELSALGLSSSSSSSMSSDDIRRYFAEVQMDAYERGLGWTYWSFKLENSNEWDFLYSLNKGWIPNPVTDRKFNGGCGN
ncbi:hypothetical protein EV182_001857 [Spiromyces aspiralis]|uniref:Uncharacterized protein n=1 Tax=Spiromyces aspiralis TaxID=68401 RepID=A0ACC1HEV0_9FUNG|nr:hypothetical protein EV182_001857 [Spiromyces aspiralis]